MLDGTQSSYRARALIFLAGLFDDIDRGAEAVEHVRLSIGAAAPFDADLQVSAAMGMGSVLAERVDPVAARYAHDAIELCRNSGSAEQLAIALPTTAMVCWQVGALDEARATSPRPFPCTQASLASRGWCCCPPRPAFRSPTAISPPPWSSARQPIRRPAS